MAEEYTHSDLDFTDTALGADWDTQHQTQTDKLLTLLKHISGDGTAFTPPTVDPDSLHNIEFIDPDSTDPAGDINAALTDNTTIVLPPGTYELDAPIDGTGLTDIEIIGAPGSTITCPSAYSDDLFNLGSDTSPADNVVVKNLTFDFTSVDGTMPIHVVANNRFEVEDIYVNGEIQNTATGQNGGRFALKNANAKGWVTNYNLPDGGDASDALHGLVVPSNESDGGMIRFRDLHIENFTDNALYCSTTATRILVEGGVFRNNEISQVRVHSDASHIKDCIIEVTQSGLQQTRGVWLHGGEGHQLTNVTMDMTEASAGALLMHDDVTGTVTCTGITADINTEAFTTGATNVTLVLRDSYIYGSGDTNIAAFAMIDGILRLYDVNMDFPDEGGDGTRTAIRFDSDRSIIEDCNITTTRQALWIRAADCEVRNCVLESQDGSWDDFQDEGTDTSVYNTELVTGSLDDSGTRPRYNGVIGGGFFAPVSLSSVGTAAEDGAQARSDGSATGFSEGAIATYTNGDWVRADGQETFTP